VVVGWGKQSLPPEIFRVPCISGDPSIILPTLFSTLSVRSID
jgi:hypothetical protein